VFKERLQKEQPGLFAQVPAKVWKRHWNVDCRPAGSARTRCDLSRYVFKTATGNRPVKLLPAGKLRWTYRASATGQRAALQLEPLEFMARLLQHILPPHFARVRTFGWLHPAAKVRGNRVRACWGQPRGADARRTGNVEPAPDPDLETPADKTPVVCAAPLCPPCQQMMRLVGAWRPGRPSLSQTAAMNPSWPPDD